MGFAIQESTVNGRVKFQVWSPVRRRWRTAYVLPHLLESNINCMVLHGFTVRTVRDGVTTYHYDQN